MKDKEAAQKILDIWTNPDFQFDDDDEEWETSFVKEAIKILAQYRKENDQDLRRFAEKLFDEMAVTMAVEVDIPEVDDYVPLNEARPWYNSIVDKVLDKKTISDDAPWWEEG